MQIIQGSMRREVYRAYPDVHFSLLIHIQPEKMNIIEDTMFLMNVISDMSRVDFRLYKSSQAAGRMIFSVQDEFMISGMLVDDKKCMAVNVSTEASHCRSMFETFRQYFPGQCMQIPQLCFFYFTLFILMYAFFQGLQQFFK